MDGGGTDEQIDIKEEKNAAQWDTNQLCLSQAR